MPKSTATRHRHLVSINQAAEYADVHHITLRRWVAAGRVRAYRVGPRLLKIDLDELEEALVRPLPTTGPAA